MPRHPSLRFASAAAATALFSAAALAQPAVPTQPPTSAPAKQPTPTPPPAQPKHKPGPAINPAFGIFKDALPMIQRSPVFADGRIDHLDVDPATNRIYIACAGHNSLEVLDGHTSQVAQSIPDLPGPQSVLFIPSSRTLVVSCGGDGSVHVFKADDEGLLTPQHTIQFAGDANAICYDAAAGKVFVGHGRNIGSFSLETGEKGKSITYAPKGKTEGMVIETSGPRMFVNIAATGDILVVDRTKDPMQVVATWPLSIPGKEGAAAQPVKGNFPMAFDEASSRLFVACRDPAVFLAIDAKTGAVVSSLEIAPDANDVWYDKALKRVYVSCGGAGGAVHVIQQSGPDQYAIAHTQTTASGCRTSVLCEAQRRLIVAAPKIGADSGFLYIYQIGP